MNFRIRKILHLGSLGKMRLGVISFGFAFLLGNLASGQSNIEEGEWGSLTGTIQVDGRVPSPEKLDTSNTPYCQSHKLNDESLIVSDTGGVANVFVYLYQPRRNRKTLPIHPDALAAMSPPVLDNLNCRFEPHALLLSTTQPIVVKNSDEIGHNAYFESRYNSKNQTVPSGQQIELNLENAERAPFKVSCGSHGWMSAYVLVRDNPYMAITNRDGVFTIDKLPPGEWTFRFWHERTRYLSQLEQDGSTIANRQGEIVVQIEAGKTTDLGKLLLDAALGR